MRNSATSDSRWTTAARHPVREMEDWPQLMGDERGNCPNLLAVL